MIRSAGRTTEGPRAAVWEANSSMKSSGKSSDHIGRSIGCFNQSGNAFEPADAHPLYAQGKELTSNLSEQGEMTSILMKTQQATTTGKRNSSP